MNFRFYHFQFFFTTDCEVIRNDLVSIKEAVKCDLTSESTLADVFNVKNNVKVLFLLFCEKSIHF